MLIPSQRVRHKWVFWTPADELASPSALYFCLNTRTLKALVHLLPALQRPPPPAWLSARGKKNTELLHQIQGSSKSWHAHKTVGKCAHKKSNMDEYEGEPPVAFTADFIDMFVNVTFEGVVLIYLASAVGHYVFKDGPLTRQSPWESLRQKHLSHFLATRMLIHTLFVGFKAPMVPLKVNKPKTNEWLQKIYCLFHAATIFFQHHCLERFLDDPQMFWKAAFMLTPTPLLLITCLF